MPNSRASQFLLIAQLVLASCSFDAEPPKKRIEPVYDKKTGKLQLLKYDSDGNGQIDTWSYMDGAHVVRIEVDRNEDGQVDRWEYYGSDEQLEKIGFSTRNDGREDGWLFTGPDGVTTRIELSTHRDGKVSRVEFYEKNLLARAEEDTDVDGRIDKWETYDGARLALVAFDSMHRGVPDRRIVYGADATARVEVDAHGDGHFVAVGDTTSGRSNRGRE